MSEFIKLLLSLSLSGTLLMLFVLLSKRLYKDLFSRRWQYYIWLIAALRFVLPFTPDSTLTGLLFARMENTMLTSVGESNSISNRSDVFYHSETDTSATVRNTEISNRNISDSGNTINNNSYIPHSGNAKNNGGYIPYSDNILNNNNTTGSNNIMNRSNDAAPDWDLQSVNHTSTLGLAPLLRAISRLPRLDTYLFCIWLTAALLLLMRKITIYQDFISFLKTGSTPISDSEVLNLLAGCKERLNVRANMELCTNTLIASPIMVGFFHPCILLPANDNQVRSHSSMQADIVHCNSEQKLPTQDAPIRKELTIHGSKADSVYMETLYYIFNHELIHYKRRDMFYKWFIQLVLCVHWFNPFVRLLARATANDCELACDEAVIANLDDAGKRAYGDTLLAFLHTGNAYKIPVSYVTLTEGAKEMKERLGAIMKFQKKTNAMKLTTAAVTAAVCICFMTLGAYAKSGRNDLPDGNIQNSGAFTEADLPDGNTLNNIASAKADLPDGDTRNNSASEKTDLPDGNTLNNSTSTKADFGVASTMANPKKPALSIVHESADILFYEDGSPYIHDVLTNYTDKTITETEYCMLSFSVDGQPLELKWNFLDSSANESNDCLISTGGLSILSNETENYQGGWSLEKDTAAKMAYNIFCLKKVVFEDGTVWENPEYESWHETYAGKEISVQDLENYYPHTYFIP